MISQEDQVILLCEAIGYGRVMEIASDAWARKDPVGAITLGPCIRTVQEIMNDPKAQTLDLLDEIDHLRATLSAVRVLCNHGLIGLDKSDPEA